MDPTKNADTLDAQLLDIMLRAGSRWVLWLLLSLSLVAVAVMLERIWFFIQSRRQHSQVQKALDTMRKSGCQAALQDLQNAQSMEAEVARACLVSASFRSSSGRVVPCGMFPSTPTRAAWSAHFLTRSSSAATALVASVTIDARTDVCPMNRYPTLGVVELPSSQVCVMGAGVSDYLNVPSESGVFAFRYRANGVLGLIGQAQLEAARGCDGVPLDCDGVLPGPPAFALRDPACLGEVVDHALPLHTAQVRQVRIPQLDAQR